MDCLDLLPAIARGLPWFEKKQVGVAENRGERVVDARAHFKHVASQRRVMLRRQSLTFRTLRAIKGFDAPQCLDRYEYQGTGPAVALRQNQQLRILRLQR